MMNLADRSANCETDVDSLKAIRLRYGELLSLDDLAEFYRYPSVQAVRKAHQRNSLPVPLYRFPNKNGYFAKAAEVAKSVDQLVCVQACHK